jgi:hypothetical protein
MVLGRAAHHGGPYIKARLKGLGLLAVTVAVPPIIGVHEDVGAALQLGIHPTPRLELKGAGAGPGDGRALASRSPVRPTLPNRSLSND